MTSKAVVVGGSMAGLCAARVLSERFDQVLVVERDDLPVAPDDRRGVPQGRHAHALLMVGAQHLREWFPTIGDELVARGALLFDPSLQIRWHQAGGERVRFPSGLMRPLCSRALLEHVVREHVRTIDNVVLRRGSVNGVLSTRDGSRVTGVDVDASETIDAELVVDASGRTARSTRWLADLGYEPPPTSEVVIDMGYATRILRRDPAHDDFRVAVVLGDPPRPRHGVAFALEDDRWMVTLAGFHGDHASRDPDEWSAFANSLWSPLIADLIASSEPLTPVVTHRLRSNLRRHVESLRRVPGGLVMLGDAVASFNPIYGQGMTSAMLQAVALGDALDRSESTDARFVRRYNRAAAAAVSAPWALSTGADFTHPKTTGPRPRGVGIKSRYMRRVFRACHGDADVVRRVVEVTHLVRPPSALLSPRFAYRVLTDKSGIATGRGARADGSHERHSSPAPVRTGS